MNLISIVVAGLLSAAPVSEAKEPQCGAGVWDAATKSCACSAGATLEKGRCELHECGMGKWDVSARQCVCPADSTLKGGSCVAKHFKMDGSDLPSPRKPETCGSYAHWSLDDKRCVCDERFVKDANGYCRTTPAFEDGWAGCTQQSKESEEDRCWPGTVLRGCGCHCAKGKWDAKKMSCVE